MRRDLEQLERRWGLAVQSAGFGVWDLDVHTQTVRYSPEWKAMLGYGSTDEADSTAVWRGRVHPEDLPGMLEALSHHLFGSQADYSREFRLRTADGSYRWVLSRGRVVERDADGRPARAVGTLIDLTDRHEAERLRLERDRAEAASAAKSEFLARMSHELRTPLNAVLGFAQVLTRRLGHADVEEQRRHLAHIEQAGWHLLQLIEDVLDLAQIDNGRLQIEPAPVGLGPAIEAAGNTLAALATQRAVQWLPAEVPAEAVAQADPGRLQQVLLNLLRNAVQYNRPGGTVRVVVRPAASGWTVEVEDTGVGIPPAQMPHLFEPFNRLGRPPAGVDGIGVGVGLVLVRSLLEAMGSRLEVRSTEGVGSCFSFTLPAPQVAAATAEEVGTSRAAHRCRA